MRVRQGNEPHDRLTRISVAAITAVTDHAEAAEGDRAIVLLFSHDNLEGGIGAHGYGDQLDAAVDMLIHVEAMMKAAGKTLTIVPLDQRGQG